MIITSFPPVTAPGARVLILGSMPGQESLRRQRYYAHPRNLFWPIMAELCGFDSSLPYAERLDELLRRGFALWDVLKHCERDGSLDSAIKQHTEVPNDFASFLTAHHTIQLIGFNGQKAAKAFQKHVLPTLSTTITERLTLLPLPSTSPANIGQSHSVKVARWAEILAYL